MTGYTIKNNKGIAIKKYPFMHQVFKYLDICLDTHVLEDRVLKDLELSGIATVTTRGSGFRNGKSTYTIEVK